MTMRQIGEYVTAAQERQKDDFAQSAILLDGLSQQILSVMASKHPKYLTLPKLYPHIFGDKSQNLNLNPNQRRALTAARWKSFLGK